MEPNRLYSLRNKMGLTTKQLANYLEIPEKLYQEYEEGITFPDLFLVQPLQELFGKSFHYIMENPETGKENFFTNPEIESALDSAHSCDGLPMCEHDRKIVGKILVDHLKKQREKLYKYQEQFDKNIYIDRKIIKEAKENNNFHFSKELPSGLMIFSIKKMMINGYEESDFLSAEIVPEWATTPEFYKQEAIAESQFENYYLDRHLSLPKNKWRVPPKLSFYYEHYDYYFEEGKVKGYLCEFISYETALSKFAEYES